ncbi:MULTISPECIES: NAD(P)H-dependent flavin oxidoreductase [Paracoccus]|uniref:Nitronate monooxygenase n=1 Tax=Paracoccus hibiscisoli TaxID=2023261 RepID=A0A4U0Q6M4_9RHOB|nr:MULTISPECIES: nitronate monooxygenase [Paracoccus]ODT57873.1 MAG: 2-nitropropane dioxygenase [Paracoccus sp. SCN 68-21]TJZ76883.1 nitronate monooxygenase [Paracoccus hibiscisoli]
MNVTNELLDLLQLSHPILQAPMAGVATPAMAAAVSNAGGLGALGLCAASLEAAREAIEEVQQLTAASFNVNFFCHKRPARDPAVEAAWIARAAPLFERFEAEPPTELRDIYTSFRDTEAYVHLLLELRPRVVSFHLGLPRPDQIASLRATGLILIGSATSPAEARAIEAAGLHAVVAQGWEAGGHRGLFDPTAPDARLSTQDLLRALLNEVSLPIIAAGGIMDGRDIRRMLDHGAAAVQLGTAFIGCPESAADEGYRERLALGGDTVMTRAISGRPARCLGNAFTQWTEDAQPANIPDYPCAYDLAKAVNTAAKAKGATAYGAQWAGAQVSRARTLPAAEFVEVLVREMKDRAKA